MKKYLYIFIASALSAGVFSCSLDKTPKAELGAGNVSSVKDITGLAQGLYSISRPINMGEQAMWSDYMADVVSETTNSGNRGSFFYNQMLTANDGSVAAIWNDTYKGISRANFLLSVIDNIEAANGDEQVSLDQSRGEAYFWRAIFTRHLALRFCKDYEPSSAASDLGVPLMTSFDLTAKPGRGTLADTYTQILADITEAVKYINRTGAANSEKLTVDALTAFKAMVDVDMHNYSAAISAINSLASKYPLATTADEVKTIWSNDESSEIIYQTALTNTELNSAYYYYDYVGGSMKNGQFVSVGAYIPQQWVIDLYSANDWRTGQYISEVPLTFGTADVPAVLLTKFLGAAKLRTNPTNPNNYNSAKLFKMSDLTLLKAECEYVSNSGDALATLNTMRAARGLAALTGITGEALFTEIQNERVRELIGEGGRVADMKRWKLSHTRVPQTALVSRLAQGVNHTKNIVYSDNTMLLPIPLGEFSLNPNLSGQQNAGYNEK